MMVMLLLTMVNVTIRNRDGTMLKSKKIPKNKLNYSIEIKNLTPQ